MNAPVNRRSFLSLAALGAVGALSVGAQSAHSFTELSEQAQKLLAGVTWFKQSGFRIQDGETVIYIDPYQLTNAAHDADLILVSHSHSDHCDSASVTKIVKDGSVLATEPESEAALRSVISNIVIFAPGETITAAGIAVEGVRSYNLTKTNHPKSKNYLGFILTLHDGRRIYHAGDTDKIPEMDNIRCDVALLPCGGTFSMDASQAAEAAQVIQPKIVVPMHYGSAVGSVKDAQKLQNLLSGIIEVVIFDPGQSVDPITAVPGWRRQ
jgi:L-ascorbate metabolism protein UlaG (beta-lactamase superfamily)